MEDTSFLYKSPEPKGTMELNLESFSGLCSRDRDSLARIFCAVRDMPGPAERGFFPTDVFMHIKGSMAFKDFGYLCEFLESIGIFKEGVRIAINPDSEYIIRLDLVD